MAKLSDLKFTHRAYMKAYRYRQVDWRPGARLAVPLAEARVAVVTTAALHLPTQPAFDEELKGGDFSYRILPSDARLDRLLISHKSDAFDASGLESDKNLALPLDRVRELVAEGYLGAVSDRHFSFMGSISQPDGLIRQSSPEIVEMLRADRVDAVLLTPV